MVLKAKPLARALSRPAGATNSADFGRNERLKGHLKYVSKLV